VLDTTTCTIVAQLSKLELGKKRCANYGQAWLGTTRPGLDLAQVTWTLSSSILCEIEWRIHQLRPSSDTSTAVVATAELAVGYMVGAAQSGSILKWCSPIFDHLSAVATILEQVCLVQNGK
jgi:hypothetical protein